MERLHHPLVQDPLDPLPHSQIAHKEAEGGEWVRGAGSEGRESRDEKSRSERKEGREEGGESGDNREVGAERVSEDGDREEAEEEEELTQVEELKKDQLLAALGDLENDDSFQCAEDKEEIF